MHVSDKIIVKAVINELVQKIDWKKSAEEVKAVTAYNSALNDLSTFIQQYEKGEIEKEYIETIVQKLIGDIKG
jgi:hypothetical protein